MVEINEIHIKDNIIGQTQKTFIIAEAGINHNGDIETAKKMIIEAKKAGADAVKFQTYITEKRVPKDSEIYGILKKCELSNEQTRELNEFSKEQGIIFFSTPFDKESVDLLCEIGIPVFKLASFDIINKDLLKYVASKKKPVIFSRGMANEEEIKEAISILDNENVNYALLHCVSSYPTKKEDANLNIIKTLKKKFSCPIGYSDHTMGIEVPLLAVAAGACIIEKHFTLDKNMEGPDHKLSCEPQDLKEFVQEVRKMESIMGNEDIRLIDCEKPTVPYRRKG